MTVTGGAAGVGPAPGAPGELLSGGHYRLGDAVTAAVRVAHDAWEDRTVVAVALAPEDDGPPGPHALTRVVRDVRRGAEHPHPGLAPARDVAAGRDRDLWLVHDLPADVRGLSDLGALPASRVLALAVVLAGGLAAAHAARLVHGRIGPDVVLVGAEPSAVWLVGAPSGRRPDERPPAEDGDARALAATLAAVPVAPDPGEDDAPPAGDLAALLARVAHERPDTPGGLGAALLRDLQALTGVADPVADHVDDRGTEDIDTDLATRLTEVIPTSARTAPATTAPVGEPDPDAGTVHLHEPVRVTQTAPTSGNAPT